MRTGGIGLVARRFIGVALVVALCISLLAYFAVPADAARGLPCRIEVKRSTTLKHDCVGSITIIKSDITLDCAGHTVTGSGAGIGITLGPGVRGITIRNCVVTRFDIGFFLNGTTSDTLTKNTADADGVGFQLWSSSSSTLANNTANYDVYGNFQLWSSSSNTLANNTADCCSSGSGFLLTSGSSNNMLVNNTAIGDHFGFLVGLFLPNGSSNTLVNNTAIGKMTGNDIGFFIDGSPNSMLANNTAVDYNTGFDIEGSSNTLANNTADADIIGFALGLASSNTLASNTANGNYQDGFLLEAVSSFNTLAFNVANNNAGYGYNDASSGSGTSGTANTYVDDLCSGNAAGGSSPAGLCS